MPERTPVEIADEAIMLERSKYLFSVAHNFAHKLVKEGIRDEELNAVLSTVDTILFIQPKRESKNA